MAPAELCKDLDIVIPTIRDLGFLEMWYVELRVQRRGGAQKKTQ